FHSAAHGLHSHHQDREAQHDIADISVYRTFAEHPEHDTHHRHDGRDRRCGKDGRPASCSFNIGETQDPSCNTCTDVGSHDDTDRLPEFHHHGIDETDNHHRCCGG